MRNLHQMAGAPSTQEVKQSYKHIDYTQTRFHNIQAGVQGQAAGNQIQQRYQQLEWVQKNQEKMASELQKQQELARIRQQQ